MAIENLGSEADRLVAITSTMAARIVLHEDRKENGVMKMRQLDEVDLNRGKTVVFRPGGLHVMLIGVSKRLVEHDRFPMTLTFRKAGSVTIEVSVE
jgi:periplasmic copper chaperone A